MSINAKRAVRLAVIVEMVSLAAAWCFRRHSRMVFLRVTNRSGSALYVPRHFNSVNCAFLVLGGGFNSHGDGPLPPFEDFMRLEVGHTMEISAHFRMRQAGEGEFSVSFYANLEPEVRQKLHQTGTPFIVELEHSFGTIIVQASNERSGVDAGQASRFAFLRPCPGATHRERSAR